jgi:hypothetical protein
MTTSSSTSTEFEHLRSRLLYPPERPTWGPKVARPSKPKWRLSNQFSSAAEARNPGQLSESDRHQIEANYEAHRRIFSYRPMYLFAAIFSAVVAVLALFVDYHIIASDVWTRALADEFGVVPDSLRESVIYKSLQVVFATLAVHFLLKLTGGVGRFVMVVVVCLVTFAMIGGLGFVVANNNLAAGASGVRSVENENNQLGDALTQLGLKPANEAGTIAIPSSAERAPGTDTAKTGEQSHGGALVNLNLQDWFVFKSLPEEWRKNAQVNLWLIFVGVIFFVITTVSALYLQSAERNLRNVFDASAFKQREKDYSALMAMTAQARSR